ncbi:MAG: phosphonate ABC transporter, permease protein PhnE [Clostridia bacterium]|nr:phosphonate ABC transporter, permease protein PhnE [Clostridia bacterium]MBQ4157659.1 phosphonate ABC transporter, permease protein PhnE [Clostridia bacterium]
MFDFHGTISDGKVVTETEEAKETDQADKIAVETTVPENNEVSETEETIAVTDEKEDGFIDKAVTILYPYTGSIALAGLIFLALGIIALAVVPIAQEIKKDKLTDENIKSSERVLKAFILAPNKWLLYLIIVIIVVLIIGWSSSSIEWKGFASKGSEVAYGIVYGITHPDKAYILSLGADKVPYLLLETIAIALLGTLIGGMIAIPVAFMASENVVPKWFAFIIRSIILAIRTIPSFVWALCWIRVTGPGAFCGVLTQSLCSIGMISKMYITAIEDLDTKILESLDACGCTTFQKIRYGIIPQLTANFISTIIYRFDINLKDATTLGIVGAGGIGAALIQAISGRRWSIVGSFLFGMIILMMIIEFVSTKIRAKLARG